MVLGRAAQEVQGTVAGRDEEYLVAWSLRVTEISVS